MLPVTTRGMACRRFYRSNIQWMKDDYTSESSSYSYDDHTRLTKDVVAGGTNPRSYTFSYDAAGNRLTAVVTATSPSSQSLTYNSGNQSAAAATATTGPATAPPATASPLPTTPPDS